MNTGEVTDAQLIEADERLQQVLRHTYCIRQSEQAPVVHKQLLPNYEMLLVFNFGPDVPVSIGDKPYVVRQTAVMGPLNKPLRYEVPPGADIMVVVFTLNGFYRLLGKPMHELRGMDMYDPDLLLNQSCFHDLWVEMAAIRSSTERIRYLNEYALQYIAPTDEDTRTVINSLPYFDNPAVDPVKAIAEARHLSTRSVQSRFQTNLGFSAKELVRFLRFKKVAAQLVNDFPKVPDWADLVLTHGYHDQSHLIKDFQQFMGMAPTEFIRQLAGEEVCITRPGAYY